LKAAFFKIVCSLLILAGTISCALQAPRETVATVLKAYIPGKGTVITYHANGKRIIALVPYIRGTVSGEKYKIWYDSLHLFRFDLQTNQPLFLEDEKTTFSKAVINRCIPDKYFTKVKFVYQANGRSYYKKQYMPGQYFFARGEELCVEYLEKDPRRSILRP
jgi:hypothetical protein